ncbi:hypothetical protein LINPERPRIM_LOCUS20938 [Linum perenne]
MTTNYGQDYLKEFTLTTLTSSTLQKGVSHLGSGQAYVTLGRFLEKVQGRV